MPGLDRYVQLELGNGQTLPVATVEAYRERGVVLRQGYGLTEVGVNCFAMTSEEALSHAGAIGRPLMFTEARLVDADGQDVPRGEVGELLLGGANGLLARIGTGSAGYDDDLDDLD